MPYTNLTMHEIKKENPTSPVSKKRISYEDSYEERRRIIDTLGIDQIAEYRKSLIEWGQNIDNMLKKQKITDRRRNYLSGLKKHVVTPLLNYAKQRTAIINIVIYNGTPRHLAERFLIEAAARLPMDMFQEIYGAALKDIDIEDSKINHVRDFMKQCLEKRNAKPFKLS